MGLFSKYPGKFKAEVTALENELAAIGKADDFLSERPGGQFDRDCRHIRAREIGARLHEIGGLALLEDEVKRMRKRLDPSLAEHMEYCWRGIQGF